MIDKIRSYVNGFYYNGKRVPIPVNDYIFKHKSKESIECFKLFAYLTHETSFFAPETKLFIISCMSYQDLGNVMEKKSDTVRAAVNKDKSKLFRVFGNFEIPCKEHQSIESYGSSLVLNTNLALTEKEHLKTLNFKLKEYLSSKNVDTEAPKTEFYNSEMDRLKAEIDNKSNEIAEVRSALSLYSDPNNNENLKLQVALKEMNESYQSLLKNYELLNSEFTEQSSVVMQLEEKLSLTNNYYQNLSEVLSFKPERKKPTKPFNPNNSANLADNLTRFIKAKLELIGLFKQYSDADIKALNDFLAGIRPDDQEYCQEVNRILVTDWGMKSVNNIFIDVLKTK